MWTEGVVWKAPSCGWLSSGLKTRCPSGWAKPILRGPSCPPETTVGLRVWGGPGQLTTAVTKAQGVHLCQVLGQWHRSRQNESLRVSVQPHMHNFAKEILGQRLKGNWVIESLYTLLSAPQTTMPEPISLLLLQPSPAGVAPAGVAPTGVALAGVGSGYSQPRSRRRLPSLPGLLAACSTSGCFHVSFSHHWNKLLHTKMRMTNSTSFWKLQVSKVEVDEPSHPYLP